MNEDLVWFFTFISLSIFVYVYVKALYKIKNNEIIVDRSLYPFRKKKFLTYYEMKLYNILVNIIFNEHYNRYHVFLKTRLADLVEVSIKWKWYLSNFNRIKNKHIDFVITDRDFNPILAIELNDNSHNYEKRFDRDNFVNMVLSASNINFLIISWWQLNKDYISNLLKSSI